MSAHRAWTRWIAPATAMLVVAAPARAQLRAEATVAARATQARGSGAPGARASAGAALGASAAWQLVRRGAFAAEVVGHAGHERAAEREGGDMRALLRLAWSREGRAGLTFEGGGVLAWRASAVNTLANVPGDSVPRDSSPAIGPALPARVRGAATALGAWARVGRVLVSTSARATTAGSLSQSFWETHETIVDSTDLRSRYDSLAGRWVSDTVHLGPMTRYTYTQGERRRRIVLTDFVVDAATTVGPVAMSLAGGLRHTTFEGPGEGWASARATFMMRDGLGVSLQAARLTSDRLRALPGRSELQLGVVLRPSGPSAPPVALPIAAAAAARTFTTRQERSGHVTFILRAPGARSVELMGDFTAWRVVALERGRGDAWQVTLPLERGVHHLNIRVDGGAWTPPPGLGVGDDGFGGTFGLLVL